MMNSLHELRRPIMLTALFCSLFTGSLTTVGAAPTEGLCNAFPSFRPSILAHLSKVTSAVFVARVKADPAYAAMLGNPVAERPPYADSPGFAYSVDLTYPPLEDVDVIAYRLQQTGEFDFVMPNNSNACFIPPPPAQAVFAEFYNSELDHYFYSGSEQEIAAIDAGKVGRWVRTGKSFRAVTEVAGCLLDGTLGLVYRFYGTPGKGPNSHFFTRDRAECYVVDKSGQWALEGVPFYARTPSEDATCNGRGVPLYRVWRPFGDSNHRYTTERGIVAEMVAKGWVEEGVSMCI